MSTLKPPKEETVNLLSFLIFWWTNTLIKVGFKRDLNDSDLYEIPDENKSQAITDGVEKAWNLKMRDYLNKLKLDEEEIDEFARTSKKAIYKKTSKTKAEEDIKLNNENKSDASKPKSLFSKWSCNKEKPKTRSEPSLGLTLVKIFLVKFTAIITVKLSHDLLNFARPILLDKLINFIKDKEQTLYIGFFYIFLLCLASLVQTLIMQHYYQDVYIMGNQLKIGLQNLIYRKSMRLSTTARKETTVGEMTNLLTTNSATFEWCTFYLVGLLSTPLQVLITTFMLWQYMRWATIAGMASMLIFMPLNAYFARLSKRIRKSKYKLQDARIKTMNEVLTGIRVIKFYGLAFFLLL
jgi:ABC-type bacteriocin/lantibiotic exporter with double-glycine peptidase domain